MKPDKKVRQSDCYRRQLKMLEIYLSGRVSQLKRLKAGAHAQASECDMAMAEINTVLNEVLPEMRKVQP